MSVVLKTDDLELSFSFIHENDWVSLRTYWRKKGETDRNCINYCPLLFDFNNLDPLMYGETGLISHSFLELKNLIDSLQITSSEKKSANGAINSRDFNYLNRFFEDKTDLVLIPLPIPNKISWTSKQFIYGICEDHLNEAGILFRKCRYHSDGYYLIDFEINTDYVYVTNSVEFIFFDKTNYKKTFKKSYELTAIIDCLFQELENERNLRLNAFLDDLRGGNSFDINSF